MANCCSDNDAIMDMRESRKAPPFSSSNDTTRTGCCESETGEVLIYIHFHIFSLVVAFFKLNIKQEGQHSGKNCLERRRRASVCGEFSFIFAIHSAG